MYNIVLIGAGQLGSRHLQSLANLNENYKVFVIDTSEESLKISKERYEQVKVTNPHQVQYAVDYNNLPSVVDLAIIATSANVRDKVTKTLMGKAQVKNIVFEKIAFQNVQVFEDVLTELKENKIHAWVNCPRRMFVGYQKLKDILSKEKSVFVTVSGGDWGLACNCIHFLDFISYLNQDIQYSLDFNHLDKKIYESKRSGFKEFTGTIIAKFVNGTYGIISSIANSNAPIIITIIGASNRVLIDESSNKIEIKREGNKWQTEIINIGIKYQSQLSEVFVKSILEDKKCRLTSVEESFTLHKPFLDGLCEFIGKLTGKNVVHCPIT